jgi:hypothetical protein
VTDDRAQRTAALDPAQSFIVEAPAGSGKTELLTQRFLGLLATVDLPEQIVAITFTRKAAAEMRQRIVATLLAAADDEPNVPSHRLATLALARRALARSDELGWALPTQSQRLRILTIDALNSNLAGHFPVLAGGVAGAEVTDDAQRLYRLAAQRTTDGLAESDALGEALGHWLQASGNALQQLEFWLAGMLPQRDRWQRLFAAAGGSGLTTTIEGSLGRLRDARCRRLGTLAGAVGERRIAAVLAEREQNLEGPPAPAAPTDLWPAVARLLLTRSGDWRRRFTRTEGFPPDATELRAELDAILEIFSATPGLREAWLRRSRIHSSRGSACCRAWKRRESRAPGSVRPSREA